MENSKVRQSQNKSLSSFNPNELIAKVVLLIGKSLTSALTTVAKLHRTSQTGKLWERLTSILKVSV